MTENDDRQMGIQPLDAVLTENDLTNKDLVAASTEQLTHKQVQKARKGRKVTANIQHKILNALNSASDEGRKYSLRDLFTYEG